MWPNDAPGIKNIQSLPSRGGIKGDTSPVHRESRYCVIRLLHWIM